MFPRGNRGAPQTVRSKVTGKRHVPRDRRWRVCLPLREGCVSLPAASGDCGHTAAPAVGVHNMVRSSLRWPFWAVLSSLGLMLTAVAAGVVWAADAPNIVRIEEDWELVIGTPSPNSDAPQVTCLIAPMGERRFPPCHLHRQPPRRADLRRGRAATAGLERRRRSLASKRYPDQAVLNTPGETIRWTQVMRSQGRRLGLRGRQRHFDHLGQLRRRRHAEADWSPRRWRT